MTKELTIDPVILTEKQTKDLCKLGGGPDQCIYLVMGKRGFCCAKGTPLGKVIIESAGLTTRAAGDNCSGAPSFLPTNSVHVEALAVS